MGKSPLGSGSSRKLLRAAGRAQGSNPDRKLQTRSADQEEEQNHGVGQGHGDSWAPSRRTGCCRHAQHCGEENGCAVPEEGRPGPVQSLPSGGDPSLRTLRMAVPEAGWTVPAPRAPRRLQVAGGQAHSPVVLTTKPCEDPLPLAGVQQSLRKGFLPQGQCNAWASCGNAHDMTSSSFTEIR